MRLASLRARLLLAGAIGSFAVVALATVLIGEAYYAANERAFDRQLRVELDRLIGSAEIDANGRLAMAQTPSGDAYGRPFSGSYWQVDHDGAQLRSRSLWDAALELPDIAMTPGEARARDATGPGGEPLREIVRVVRLPHSSTPTRFVVAADRSGLIADAAAFRRLVAGTVAALAAVLLAAVWYQVRFTLRPLDRMARALADVRAGQRTRLGLDGLPREVAPLAEHLDELLAHHERTVARARSAAQDLAHAIKTPLSVLAVAAERPDAAFANLVREQSSRISAAIDRQLQGAAAADTRQRAPVMPVLDALVDAMRRIHAARDVAFAATGTDDAVFAGDADDLAEMIGNLLDNAGKWARAQVTATVVRDGTEVRIDIADDGPGMPAHDIERAMERGVRLDERVPGSGLGLSIVRRIAESYGGSLAIDSGAAGLRARLLLPGA